MDSTSRNRPSHEFPFSRLRLTSLIPRDNHSLLLHRILLCLLPLDRRDKVNVNGSPSRTLGFSSLCLSSFRPPFHLLHPAAVASSHFCGIPGLWRKSDERKGGFRQTHFAFFPAPPGERVFPLRQIGTSRGRMASKIAFSPPLWKGDFAGTEFTRKLNENRGRFLILFRIKLSSSKT